MSTKSTILYGTDFHLYIDLADEDEGVWLSLRGKPVFEAYSDEVDVKIPTALWEHIRQAKVFNPEYHEMSDQDIVDYVTCAVDNRILDYKDSNQDSLLSYVGCMVYGLASSPREEQIKNGIEHITRRRAQELAVLAQIQAYKDKK